MSAPLIKQMLTAGNLQSLALRPEDMRFFCDAIESLTGISMRESKQDLVKSRLRQHMYKGNFQTYESYRQHLESLPADHEEWQNFVNLLTTNKTDFFREDKHFEYLIETIIPEWLKGPHKTMRVWSAASSTGEEAYTLAMILTQHLPPDRDFRIVASDVDTEVLRRAKNGVYPRSQLHEIPEAYQKTCVDLGKGEAIDWFRIRRSIHSKLEFHRYNLLDAEPLVKEPFDLIFCRNVFIYFKTETIDGITAKLARCLRRPGHLFISHTENLSNQTKDLKPVAPAVYRVG